MKMFKVPDWGTDVPDSGVNFAETSHKKKGKKLSLPATQDSPVKPQVNGDTQVKQTTKKSTDKRKLKKIRQKNRQIYQTLSNPQHTESNHSEHQPGRFVLNPNKSNSPINKPVNVINNVKHTEPNKKYDKHTKPKPNKPQKQKIKKQKPIMAPSKKSDTEMKGSKKRKFEDSEISNIELNNVDTDNVDEVIINAKKKKLNDDFKKEDQEDILFAEKPKIKFDRKKAQLKKMLEKHSNRSSINVSGNSNSLRERMIAKLQAAQFRYLNEKLYTSTGSEAQQLFVADPTAFETYHQGYQQQIKKWPVNPLDVIVKRIMKMPRSSTIADMGCGAALLSQRVPHHVRSFDLVAVDPRVETCDMAHTPLLAASVDVVVYCLALMATNLAEILAEGNRVLKTGGHLLIAEVESRFDSLEEFTRGVERLGFKLVKADQSHKVFHFLEFRKVQEASKKARHVPLALKPCLYKRR